MGKDPAFLFYPGDYISGTMGMSFEEKGAYVDLLMMQFNRGHMTSHMIGHVLGHEGGHLWDNLKVKFTQDENGLFYNRRLEEEIIKRQKYAESRRNNQSGRNQYSKNEESGGGHMTSDMRGHMENENENENINGNRVRMSEGKGVGVNVRFEEFWDSYDKKVKKVKAEKKWPRLTDEERVAIMDHIPRYKEAQPDKQFRQDPITYLNNRTWEDEIVRSSKKIEQPDTSEF